MLLKYSGVWIFKKKYRKKYRKNLHSPKIHLNFAVQFSERAVSAAGLEHLPYKQRVGGSNPSPPTNFEFRFR